MKPSNCVSPANAPLPISVSIFRFAKLIKTFFNLMSLAKQDSEIKSTLPLKVTVSKLTQLAKALLPVAYPKLKALLLPPMLIPPLIPPILKTTDLMLGLQLNASLPIDTMNEGMLMVMPSLKGEAYEYPLYTPVKALSAICLTLPMT